MILVGTESDNVFFLGGLECAKTRSISIGNNDITPLFDECGGRLFGGSDIFPITNVRDDDLKVWIDAFGRTDFINYSTV